MSFWDNLYKCEYKRHETEDRDIKIFYDILNTVTIGGIEG